MFRSACAFRAGRKLLHGVTNLEYGTEGKHSQPDQHDCNTEDKACADADADPVSEVIPSLRVTQGRLRLFNIYIHESVECRGRAFQDSVAFHRRNLTRAGKI